MPLALVTGGTGYLGRYLVAELHRRGYAVRAVVRDRERAEEPGTWGAPSLAGLVDEWVVGEVTDTVLAADAVVGADTVVSALGVTTQKADPWHVDYHANMALLEAAERHRTGSFCFVNVIGGDRCPAELTKAKTAFARRLEASPVPSLIVNPPVCFSDVSQVLAMARRGRVWLLGPPGRTNPIHGADLATTCVDRLETGEQGTWDVGGPDVLTWTELAGAAFAALGTEPRTTVVPSAVVTPVERLAGVVGPLRTDALRFVAWALRTDCVGTPTGTHRVADFFADHAAAVADDDAAGATRPGRPGPGGTARGRAAAGRSGHGRR